jgi:hypothetical protein
MKDTMLDFFVQIEAEKIPARPAIKQPEQCQHCGDWSPNSYLLQTNHGLYFNGWCSRRFWASTRKNDEDLEWLSSHGFEVLDPWAVAA